jgi:hypothetical protein
MKTPRSILICLLLIGLGPAFAEINTITIETPDPFTYHFSVNGGPQEDTTIELQVGDGITNILDIHTASFHPVVVTSSVNTEDQYPGAEPQSVSDQPITLTVPTDGFPDTLYYMCHNHGFYGVIHLTATGGVVPPPNTILEVRVGTNIVMVSTGTQTTYTLYPEFSSNLVSGAWSTVPSFTNTYSNGTNITTFNRLDPICGPNVYLRLRQQSN